MSSYLGWDGAIYELSLVKLRDEPPVGSSGRDVGMACGLAVKGKRRGLYRHIDWIMSSYRLVLASIILDTFGCKHKILHEEL